MLKFVIILISCICCSTVLTGQNRIDSAGTIYNTPNVLKTNKVFSITFIEYIYTNDKKKNISEIGKINKIEIYDSLGREIVTKYYYDSTGQLSSKNLYFYIDTCQTVYKIERYNDKDSLEIVSYTKELITISKENLQFGYYKYVYSKNGLIDEAVLYINKCGSCSKSIMKPVYLMKLKYAFRQ